jgi:hypothetical protein
LSERSIPLIDIEIAVAVPEKAVDFMSIWISAEEGEERLGSPWQDPPQVKSLLLSPLPPGFATPEDDARSKVRMTLNTKILDLFIMISSF